MHGDEDNCCTECLPPPDAMNELSIESLTFVMPWFWSWFGSVVNWNAPATDVSQDVNIETDALLHHDVNAQHTSATDHFYCDLHAPLWTLTFSSQQRWLTERVQGKIASFESIFVNC